MRRACLTVLAALLAVMPTTNARAQSVSLRSVTQIYQDATGVKLQFPEGVACNGNVLAVADTGNSRVVLFDIDEDLLQARAALTIPETPRPIRLAFRPDGGLLVLDGRARRIAHVDAEGAFQGWIDPSPPGGMTPRSVKVGPDGTTYVLDAGTPRILALDASGTLTRTVELPGSVRSLADLAIDARGDVWVIDGIGSALYAADKEATTATKIADLPRERFEMVHAIAVDNSDRLFVVDRSAGRIGVLGRDGSVKDILLAMGWAAGELRYPGAICIDPHGFVFVADRENHRVQVFSLLN